MTHFEELMLHQNSNAFPANCFLKLHFTGCLDRDAFQTAVNSVVSRHPLLYSSVVRDGRRFFWEAGECRPRIEWQDASNNSMRRVDPLQLDIEHGLRIFVRLMERKSEVLIQFHHACCDGIGIYQLARELMIAYAKAYTGCSGWKLPVLDDDLLEKRELTGLAGLQKAKLVIQQAARLPSVVNFFARTPKQVAPHAPCDFDDQPPCVEPSIRSVQFDQPTSLALKSSLSANATLNDVLMRDLFLAIHSFRRAEGFGNQFDWLRLMVPTSHRRPEQYRLSAANVIGSVFVERRGVGMKDEEQLLRGIHLEMETVKRLRLGYLFNLSLMAQRRLPGGLRKMARPQRCQVSAVFTNIGRVFNGGPLPKVKGRWQCGNVLLESTEAAAPVARNVATAFGATWYANRLSITLHHDPRAMSQPMAERLLMHFRRQVLASAGMVERSEAGVSFEPAA